MVLKLQFDSPPFSINKAYYRRGNRTAEYRAWGDNIHAALDEYAEEIDSFRALFKPKKHCLKISILHLIPSNKLYTKAGEISRLSKDLTNIEKTLVDILYDSKYFKRGFSTLNIDDKFNVTMHSYKRESLDSFCIKVIVQIIPLEESRTIPEEFRHF